MIPKIDEALLALGSWPAAWMIAKATLAAALGLAGAWMARRSRAAVRHALLGATFAVLAALPIASLAAHPVWIAVKRAEQKPASGASAVSTPTLITRSDTADRAPRREGVSIAEILMRAWVAGSVLFLAPMLVGLWQVRRARRSATPWRRGQELAEELAGGRRIDVLLHATLAGPMTCGVIRPAVLLPSDAEGWSEEELRRALVHELEHVRRGDWAMACAARVVCAAHWFHPLVWVMRRRLALEAERACDDAVLGGSEATVYAEQLVALARRMSGGARPPALAMANRADLAARVGSVLDGGQKRGRAGKRMVALACGAAMVLLLGLAPLRVVAAPQAGGAATSAAGLEFTSTTTLVIANVTVSDANGNPLERFGPGDFAVSEDGRRQYIDVFEPVTAGAGVPSYYILGYYSSNQIRDGAYRAIAVKLTHPADPTWRLNYKSGYYGERPGAPGGTAQQSSARPDANNRPPIPVFRPEAQYSEEARKAKWGGTVTLGVEIDAMGHVSQVQVRRSLGLGLDEKAVQAATKWTFLPARKDGQAVSAEAQVDVYFRLL